MRRADGGYRWLLVSHKPLYDEAGKLVNWFIVGHDIEELKNTTDALRESERRFRDFSDAASGLVLGNGPGSPVLLHAGRASRIRPDRSAQSPRSVSLGRRGGCRGRAGQMARTQGYPRSARAVSKFYLSGEIERRFGDARLRQRHSEVRSTGLLSRLPRRWQRRHRQRSGRPGATGITAGPGRTVTSSHG